MKRIYLDYNASTPVREIVLNKMIPYFREHHGNPSSIHHHGRIAAKAIEEARGHVAELIGASPEEILFVSGGTEANNMVLASVANLPGGSILISDTEHPAVFNMAADLARAGKEVLTVGVDDCGLISFKQLRHLFETGPVALVSVMAANNETGVLQPVKMIARLCEKYGTLFHTDAAQAIGKTTFDVNVGKIDYVTIAAHKLGGPLGIGALYARKGSPLSRYFSGGGQEKGLRPGTEFVPQIVGFGEACRYLAENVQKELKSTLLLKTMMEKMIQEEIPGITINGVLSPRLANTSNIAFHGMNAVEMVLELDKRGFAVSSGAACHSGEVQVSRTLAAMGVEEQVALSSIRISLGPDNSEEDITKFVAALKEICKDRAN